LNIIKLLPENVANQIAAGEVIQRPASVVKELVENSLDSGATEIQLFIIDSGKTLINIIDNGCGMTAEDLEICIQRHATSKIKVAADLFNIQTMGFRGEAMSSIAAISSMEIQTKKFNNELGDSLNVKGGIITEKKQVSCNSGTSIKIKNLFFNVPARRKFLKSDNVEMRHITEEFSRIALAHPEIKMNLSHNNEEIFFLPKSNLRQRIVNLIGNKKNEQLVPVLEKTSLVSLNGFVSKPDSAKKTRGEQYLFVNSRFVKSYYLQNAIFKAFEGLIATDFFPSFFINLVIEPKNIDINIHPSKTEIKFHDEKAIYSILRAAVKKSLGQYNISPSIDFHQENSFNIEVKKDQRIIEPKINIDSNYNPFSSSNKSNVSKEIINENLNFINIGEPEQSFRFVQLKKKYILRTSNNSAVIIDQRKAHQRILFEYFNSNSNDQEFLSQTLIFPKEISLNNNDIQILKEISSDIRKIGFEYILDNRNIIIKAIPAEASAENVTHLLESIIEQYKTEDEVNLDNRNKIARGLAISMSISNNQKLSEDEMVKINAELNNCSSPNRSISGKPIIIDLNLVELEKIIK
jgi:DNA mismatch repair protein MutL|tara:strand:+ start:19339 stop:21072 length:1734 start_codon:yes stop_codon:yes gene_type:complete